MKEAAAAAAHTTLCAVYVYMHTQSEVFFLFLFFILTPFCANAKCEGIPETLSLPARRSRRRRHPPLWSSSSSSSSSSPCDVCAHAPPAERVNVAMYLPFRASPVALLFSICNLNEATFSRRARRCHPFKLRTCIFPRTHSHTGPYTYTRREYSIPDERRALYMHTTVEESV